MLLGPADYRVMPWKNGGGSTTELLIHPPGATLEGGFLWRLSTAEVAVSGPFSPFPGVDRTLMLLAGGGLELDHGGHGLQRLERPLEPVSFPGEWPTFGRLQDGPCRDFNVMTARGGARHGLTVLHLGRKQVPLPRAEVRAAYCVRGRITLGGDLLDEGGLRVDTGGAELWARAENPSVLVVVTLARMG